MAHPLTHPTKALPGDKIAVLSPSFAAPGVFVNIHEQAMRRLFNITGLIPVEYPTTRMVGASPTARADDINNAFQDPTIRAILATVGGEDQIRVIRHLDPTAIQADPKPFIGTSDNTNLHHWLWGHGVSSFYGGSSQVHLGPGPRVDDIHARSLRAALLTGERLEITDPGFSEDYGVDWGDPLALSEYGERETTKLWSWYGPPKSVTGQSWGGCLEVLQWVLGAGRFDCDPSALAGGVLLLETSETLLGAHEVAWIVRTLGERGILEAVDAILVARPPVSQRGKLPNKVDRDQLRIDQRDAIMTEIVRYNSDAVVCVGVPFGHTRPQWILPHGGNITVDATQFRIFADYS